MARSLLTQFEQMDGSHTFFDDMYRARAEQCGRHYKTENVAVVSGSYNITGSSSFDLTEVNNYIVIDMGSATGFYGIVSVSGSVATVDSAGTGTDATAGSRRHYYQSVEDDFNYLRYQMDSVIGEDEWYDEPDTNLKQMAYLIPKHPNFVGQTTQYSDRPGTVSYIIDDIDQTGYISTGAPSAEYVDTTTSGAAGDSLRFTDSNLMSVSIPGGFYPADTGTITITRDGVVIGTLDLAAAWISDGCSYEEEEGDVGSNPGHTPSHAGTDVIVLTHRRCMNTSTDSYPSFWPPYQIASMSATLEEAPALPSGFTGQISVQHTSGGSQNYIYSSFWIDIGTQIITPDPPLVAPLSPILKYLSGIPYYDGGSTFTVTGTNTDLLFDRGLVSTQQPMTFNVGGFNASNVSPALANFGLSNPCAITDTIGTYGITTTVGASNYRNFNARASLIYRDVFRVGYSSSSAIGQYRIDTYGTTSTSTVEGFDDEHKRYKGDEDFTDITLGDDHTADSNWVESNSIVVGTELVVYESTLKYPTLNHSTPYLPVGPDYSSCTGAHDYYRIFIASSAFTNGTITFSGWSNALSVVQGSNVTVELRMPNCSDYSNSNTAVWQDLSVDQTTGGANGCLGSGSAGSVVGFSFGTRSSITFGNRIIMRVTYASSTVTALTEITFSPTL